MMGVKGILNSWLEEPPETGLWLLWRFRASRRAQLCRVQSGTKLALVLLQGLIELPLFSLIARHSTHAHWPVEIVFERSTVAAIGSAPHRSHEVLGTQCRRARHSEWIFFHRVHRAVTILAMEHS